MLRCNVSNHGRDVVGATVDNPQVNHRPTCIAKERTVGPRTALRGLDIRPSLKQSGDVLLNTRGRRNRLLDYVTLVVILIYCNRRVVRSWPDSFPHSNVIAHRRISTTDLLRHSSCLLVGPSLELRYSALVLHRSSDS